MRYSLLIQQPKAIEWKLSPSEGYLFAFLFEVPTWAEAEKIDGKTFYYCSRFKVIEEVPFLTEKPDTVYKMFRSLDEKGVIKYRKKGDKDFLHITPKGATWNKATSEKNPSSEGDSEKNPNDLGKKSEPASEKNPTDNIIIEDQEINNQSTPPNGEGAIQGDEKPKPKKPLIQQMATAFDETYRALLAGKREVVFGQPPDDSDEITGILWRPQEFDALKNLRGCLTVRIKAKQKKGQLPDVPITEDMLLENWQAFLASVLAMDNGFVHKHFRPAILYNQFNDIITQLNTKKSSNGKSTNGKPIITGTAARNVIESLANEGFFGGGGDG